MTERTLLRARNAIFILYLLLAIAYNLRTPYAQPGTYVPAGLELGTDHVGVTGLEIPDIGAPDERAHVFYVRYVAGGNGLPVFRIGDGESYENHQPPLYYLLAAPVQLAARGAEGFALRLFTSLIGLAALNGVFLLARRFASDVGALAVTATAAMLPSYLALSAAVSNDPLLIVWFTYGLLVCAQGVGEGWTAKRLVLLGIICGLAMLTKTNALALVAFALLTVLVSSQRSGAAVVLRNVGIVVLVPGVLCGPWLARNAVLYGDPLGMRIFTEGFANSPKAETFIAAFGGGAYLVQWVGWWTMRSLFGVFGYAQFFLPSWMYVPGGALAIVSFLGGLVVFRKNPHLEQGSEEARKWLAAEQVSRLCWLLFAIVLITFLRFNMTYFQAQARYLLPALAPLSIALCLGVARAAPGKARAWAIFIAPAYLLLLNLYALWALGPAFDAIKR